MRKLLLLLGVFLAGLSHAQVLWPTDKVEIITNLGLYTLAGITSADLNNDGTDEIIFSSYYSTTRKIAIYNPVDGTTLEIGTSVNGGSFKFGDFDEDGYLDILFRAGAVTVYLSDDSKSFLAPGFYVGTQLANSANSMAVGDYNNDNNLDIIVAYGTPHKWATFTGDGLGGFTETNIGLPASWSPSSTFTNSIELLDFNGDAKLDIVASGKSQPSPAKYGITISLGDGAGGFTLASDYLTTQDEYANGPDYYDDIPLITDADGDSKLDIIFNDAPSNGAKILHNNGTSAPTFTSLNYGIGSYYGLVDFDGDFNDDLIVMTNNGHYDIMLSDATGNFSYDRSFATTTYQGYSFTIADINGDGDKDIVYYDGIEDKIFAATFDFGYQGYKGLVGEYELRNEAYYAAVLADLDFGGYDDLLTLFNDSLAVKMNKGNQWAFDTVTYYATPANPRALEVIDLAGDGKPEVIVGSGDVSNTNITLFTNDGTGALASSAQFTSAPVNDMASGDLNSNGVPDVVAITNTDILVMLNNGTGTLASPVSISFSNGRWVSIGDMNGDGFLDVIAQNSAGRVYLWEGDGNGGLTSTGVNDYVDLGTNRGLVVADFNNDGFDDAVSIESLSGYRIKLALGAANQLMSEATVIASGSFFSPVGFKVADFNSDGNLDIIIDTNNSKEVQVYFGDGTGSFLAPMPTMVLAPNTGSAQIAVGDINFDTKQDAVFVRNGRAFVLLNAYTQAIEPTTHASNLVVGTPDFNGTSISWDRGNGDKVMVLLAETALDMTKLPVDFAIAQDLGINTVIYEGTGTLASSGSLKKNTTYQVGVIEYTGSTVSANYFTSGFPTASFTTPKGTQTITFNYTADVPFTNLPYAGTATVNSGLPITYEVVSGPAVITTEGLIQLTGLGSVTLRAKQAGNNEWDAAIDVDQTFTVIQGSQTINFNLSATIFIDYDNYQLPIYSSAGLPISYNLDSGLGSLLVDGDTTWYVWAGEESITITASQAGSTEFSAAVPVTRSATVSKQEQTITWNRSEVKMPSGYITLRYLAGESIQMRQDTLLLNAVSSAGLPVTFIILSGPGFLKGTGTDSKKYIYNGVGAVTITAAASGDEVYNSALPVNVNFTVIKGDQTIALSPTINGNTFSSYPYDPDTWVKMNASATSGLPVTFEQYSGSATTTIVDDSVNVTNAGDVNIRITQTGDDNWNPAPQQFTSWNVGKAAQVITFEDIYDDMVVKDSVMVLSATNDSGEDIRYQITRNPSISSVSVSGNEFTMSSSSRSGAITIAAYSLATTNYTQSEQVLIDFCLIPEKPSLTLSGLGTSQIVLTSSNTWDYAEWQKDGSEWTPFAGNYEALVNEQGIYKVRARSYDLECPVSDWSDEVSIIVTQLEGALANLNVFPNPVQDQLIVELGASVKIASGVLITITSLDGKRVYQRDITSLPNRRLEIDMNDYKKGLYLVQISNEGQSSQYKIQKK